MNSAIFQGIVRHRRYQPIYHKFNYKIFLLYLDLDELEEFGQFKKCSVNEQYAKIWFKRSDYLRPVDISLKAAVRLKIWEEFNEEYRGKIFILTHLRYYNY